MSTPLRPVVAACLLAGATLLLYGYGLSLTPRSVEEVAIVEQSQSGGAALFFHVGGDRWIQPIPVYTTRLLRVIGGGDASARLATVIVAALNASLVLLCAQLIFDSLGIAMMAAILLVAMPGHFAFGRSGADGIYTMVFALLWLLGLLMHFRHDTTRSALLAGAALGAGVYASRSAPLTMTLLLILGAAVILINRGRWRSVLWSAASFAAALVPAALWFARYPETYPDTFGRWAVHLAHVRNPIDGVNAFLNWNTLGTRASLYWGFLDPAALFFGFPFVLPMLVLVLYSIVTWPAVIPRTVFFLIAGGALVSPLAGSTFGEPHYVADAATLLPFTALLMAIGVAHGWNKFQGSRR